MSEYLDMKELIARSKAASPLAVMMCGVAGSGKTTFAQKLEALGFTRLSIDEEIWAANGRYGIDYPIEMYEQLKETAEIKLRNELTHLLEQKCDVVIDFSFWQRSRRHDYKKRIEAAGGEWKLVYLKVPPSILTERLRARSQRFDANAAFTITNEILKAYLKGFEVPSGEGEIVIEIKA